MKLKNGEKVVVRGYQAQDTKAIVELIHKNFLEVNSKDYGMKAMEEMVKSHNEQWFQSLAEFAHIYVFCIEEEIIAVGSIASNWGSLTESILLTIFVEPRLHGQGIGRYIIETLEQDELFIRAKRVEIPASITAVEFYRKMGYDYKNGEKVLDEEQHYRLEKFTGK